MADLDEQFKKYNSAEQARQLEPHAKKLGITVLELALELAKEAEQKPDQQEKALAYMSVAIYEARKELDQL